MTFWGTVFCAIVALCACHGIGWQVTRWARRRHRETLRFWLSPVVGFAMLLVLIVPWGWFGPGFGTRYFRIAFAAMVLGPLVFSFRERRFWISLGNATAVLVIGTFPFTAQLLRFAAFDAFNDPWTYIVQSQWLQAKGLADPVHLANETGALSQVYFTQKTGTRAAAQFAMAAIQSSFGLDWAHDAYPIAITLFYAFGLFTVAFAVMLVRTSRRVAVASVGAVLLGLTLNGFAFGAVRGYLPQTVGLACYAGGLLAGGQLLLHNGETGWRRLIASVMCPALCLAAGVYTYSEFLPFVAVGLGGLGVASLTLPDRRRGIHVVITLAVVFCLLSVPELPRALRAIAGQAKAVVGEGIPWGVPNFVAHAWGVQAGFPDGAFYFGETRMTAAVVLFCLLGGIVLCTVQGRRALPRAVFLPFCALFAVTVALFLKFRYASTNPFGLGTGQSWSQFKLAGWISLFLFGFGMAALAAWHSARRWVLLGGSLLVSVGVAQAWNRAEFRTQKVRQTLGRDYDPFSVLKEVRLQSDALVQDAVYLNFTSSDPKSRQYFAYALLGRAIRTDWSADVFVSWMLPADARVFPLSPGVLQWRRGEKFAGGDAPLARVGAYVLERRTRDLLDLTQVEGDYGLEQTPQGPVTWVKSRLAYEVRFPAAAAARRIRVQSEVISLAPGFAFTLSVHLNGLVFPVQLSVPESHNAWDRSPVVSQSVEVPAGVDRARIEFRTDVAPRQPGGSDKRWLTFLLRNLEVSLEP
jgi:hypothetical protein